MICSFSQLEIGALEALCVQYIESSICQENVLVALDSAARLQLDPLKVCVLTLESSEALDCFKAYLTPVFINLFFNEYISRMEHLIEFLIRIVGTVLYLSD